MHYLLLVNLSLLLVILSAAKDLLSPVHLHHHLPCA